MAYPKERNGKMLKKIFCTLFIMLFMTATGVFASELEFGNVEYLMPDGSVVSSFPGSETQVTAKITAENKTEEIKDVTLLIMMYKDGVLSAMDYTAQKAEPGIPCEIETSVTISEDATQDNTIIKSYVIDSMTELNPYINSATMLCDSTEVSSVFINNERYKDFSDTSNEFKVVYTSSDIPKISVLPSDGTTKTEVTYPEKIPGIAQINITSQYGAERKIKIILYKDAVDLYALTDLKYYIGDTEYTIPGFDKNETNYEVDLPDNTFYVRMEGETIADSVTMQAQDVDFSTKTFDGVSYIQGSNIVSYAGFTTPRPAIDGVVPIKNEETKGLITVSDGENEKIYTITFRSKQPRLTSFEVTGAASDSHKPAFIGGAAVNNDNFTIAGTDRAWAYANISPNLVGGSMFMIDLAEHRNETSWFKSTGNKGEYFNFTADTPGTVYFVSVNAASNSEFTENGWEPVTNKYPTLPSGYTSWKQVNKLWNGYENDRFFMQKYEWSSAAMRANPEYYDYYTAQPTSATMGRVMKKTFAAGEQVGVYHYGDSSSHVMSVIIKWDLEQ